MENSGIFLILENSGKTRESFNLLRKFLCDSVFFVIILAAASAALGIASTRQNFGHLVEALYEAHCVSDEVADSAKVQFCHHAP